MRSADANTVLFEVDTPLGFSVRTTQEYWDLIVQTKHRNMVDKLEAVKQSLAEPKQVIRSLKDDGVLLFYRGFRTDRWICAVAKKLNGTGFLVTAYVTDTIKKGEMLWPR